MSENASIKNAVVTTEAPASWNTRYQNSGRLHLPADPAWGEWPGSARESPTCP